jgi:ATP-binding cassette subfamily F protein uup
MTYLQVSELSKSYGNKTLFEEISFLINKKNKCALIAKNGAGKTSLLNIITGYDIADSGTIYLNTEIAVSYLKQDPVFEGNNTVIEQVFTSSDKVAVAVKEYEEAMLSEDELRIQTAVDTMDRLEAWDFEREIKTILSKLKITDFDKSVNILSGGQRKRLALANVLLNKPDFLILDEPTNHLDFEMIEWLEEYLAKSEITVLLVTHDRYFLDRVCDVILELDDNQIFRYEGNYLYYLKKREERLNVVKAEADKTQNLLRSESQWMSRQPQARATKAKSRIDSFYKLKEKASKITDNKIVSIGVEGKRLGKKLIDIYNINKRFKNEILIRDFSYKFVAGERIGIFGNNGIGKSTFLNVITGNIPHDDGTIETGETISVGYFRQSSIALNDDKYLIDVIKDIAELIQINKNKEVSAAQFAEYFLFPRNRHYNYVSQLSGGEKRRLYLMTVLMKNPNFLILDEPTNDLDIMTLNVLEEYLKNFKGTVIIVSHDRYFIDKVAETLFVFEGDGLIRNFPGNYSAYKQFKIEQEKINKQNKQIQKPLNSEIKNVSDSKTKLKLSYKEKLEFEELEKNIQALYKEKNEIENFLSVGKFTTEELNEKSAGLSKIMSLIDEKEFRWLELSEFIS